MKTRLIPAVVFLTLLLSLLIGVGVGLAQYPGPAINSVADLPFDVSAFLAASVNGVPLLLVVMGLVEFIKGLGLSGNGLRAASLLLGAGLGVGYQIYTNGAPADFAAWFAYGIYGVGLGLIASKIYDMAGNIVEKAVAKAFGISPSNPLGVFNDDPEAFG